MKRALPFLLAVAFVSAVTFAQVRTQRGIEMGSRATPTYVNGPLYISNTPSGVYDGGAAIVNHSHGILQYNFGALQGWVISAHATTCADSSSVTMVGGAAVGDACFVGASGTDLNAFAHATARVTAADTAVVTVCADGYTDGGSLNLADQVWSVHCFR